MSLKLLGFCFCFCCCCCCCLNIFKNMFFLLMIPRPLTCLYSLCCSSFPRSPRLVLLFSACRVCVWLVSKSARGKPRGAPISERVSIAVTLIRRFGLRSHAGSRQRLHILHNTYRKSVFNACGEWNKTMRNKSSPDDSPPHAGDSRPVSTRRQTDFDRHWLREFGACSCICPRSFLVFELHRVRNAAVRRDALIRGAAVQSPDHFGRQRA